MARYVDILHVLLEIMLITWYYVCMIENNLRTCKLINYFIEI